MVGFRLPIHLLQVEDLRESWVGEDIVASADASLLEAERLHRPAQLREPDVAEVSPRQSIKKSVLVHVSDADAQG